MAELELVRAELVERTGNIELTFRDKEDGALWRVGIRSLREPEVPNRPSAPVMQDSPPDRPVRRQGEWYAPAARPGP
jgi:hypothetical protein